MIHTGNMPWDKIFDDFDKEYKEFFPKEPMIRRFTFKEIKQKYIYPKKRRDE